MLLRVLERAQSARLVDEVVLATPDKELCDFAAGHGFSYYLGPADDVLARYVGAAKAYSADIIVRLTADCPLLDPTVIDSCIKALGSHDYASNVLYRTFPKGLDVEVFHVDVLMRLDRLSTEARHREHVTLFLNEKRELFDVVHVVGSDDCSEMRWCVDTMSDLERVRSLVRCQGSDAGWKTVAEVMGRGKGEFVAAIA